MTQRKWKLLFLTDLHYADPDKNYVDDPKEILDQQTEFRENILRRFERTLKGLTPEKFSAICIAGDITSTGRKQGFEKFKSNAVPVLEGLVNARPAICVVPGNHDVTWGLNPDSPDYYTKKFELFRDMIKECNITSCLYPEGRTGQLSTGHTRQSGEQWETDRTITFAPIDGLGPIYRDDQEKIIVMCINSAIRCGERDMRMQAEIVDPVWKLIKQIESEKQFRNATPVEILEDAATEMKRIVERRINKYLIRDIAQVIPEQRFALARELERMKYEYGPDWASYLKVALLHHHVMPFEYQTIEHKGYELLMDSADTLKLLEDFDFDLILTGHKHQPYAQTHIFTRHEREAICTSEVKEVLIVGGPSVGGHTGGHAKGFRLVEVGEKADTREFRIVEVKCEWGGGSLNSVNRELSAARRTPWRVVECKRGLEAVGEQRRRQAGFSYREQAYVTFIGRDGDAYRRVECEDFRVEDEECTRARMHPLRLPSTSGFLDDLHARATDFTITIENSPNEQQAKFWDKAVLRFDRAIGKPAPASYSYQWYALNSFALSKRQFRHMYRGDPLKYREFTHFSTPDPVEELMIAVCFPPKLSGFPPTPYLEGPPKLRVARIDPNEENARKWVAEPSIAMEICEAHVFRYYELLNIATLRIKHPDPELSYGIEWEVPGTGMEEQPPTQDELHMQAICEKWEQPLETEQRHALLKELARVILAARHIFFSSWTGFVEASLMRLDHSGDLSVLAAVNVEKAPDSPFKEVRYEGTLRYGDGIAGRAFKANRIRVYVRSGPSDGVDYYSYAAGLASDHKILISIPVHIPERDHALESDASAYEKKVPYGVLNLASKELDCPLSSLRLPENIPLILGFQHETNRRLFDFFKEVFLARRETRVG